MKSFNGKSNRTGGFGRAGLIIILPFVLLASAYLVYKIFFISDPVVTGIEAFELLPADKTLTLKASNLKSIEIKMIQNNSSIELLKDETETAEKAYTLQIKPKELKVSDGKAVIAIKAKAGLFKEVIYEIACIIDTIPPKLDILSSPSTIQRGSAGLALLRAQGADSVYVKLGDQQYRAFEAISVSDSDIASSGSNSETVHDGKNVPGMYRVIFPAPYDIKEDSTYYVIAEDMAGNQSVRALLTKVKKKDYGSSSINIDDSFINKVISPLLNVTKISSPEAAFKKVNEDWRNESADKILEISRATEPSVLWEGRFLQLKNSKVMAYYGDEREYLYNGEKISNSVHLGYDLASFAHAPVEAANSGIIRFAGSLSIYGNAVIIDHGLGLMSIYGHLSESMVTEGEKIKKGQIIAKTGATGLAGGDHLHFGILVHGREVSPMYWWDSRWIKVNMALN